MTNHNNNNNTVLDHSHCTQSRSFNSLSIRSNYTSNFDASKRYSHPNNNSTPSPSTELMMKEMSGRPEQPSSQSSLVMSFEDTKKKPRQSFWKRYERTFSKHYQLTKNHPQNLILAIFLFLVLVASGISIARASADAELDTLRDEAISLAEETGQFFSSNLDQAIFPLFSLAQFVNELEIFQGLASQVGAPFANGSLPFVMPEEEEVDEFFVPTHRNVTGVCDEPELVERYEQIAGTIKRNSNMDGILVNLQLVPDAVVCLLHPVNNTEDFPEGVFMDNSGAIGHDLLTDPARKFIAEATVPSDKVVIAGPLTLKQCQDCDPLVEKAFIARLPIPSSTNIITVNGEDYNKWGFAVALINWKELVDRSGVYDMFQDSNLEFQLTRTDRMSDENSTTGFTDKVVVLAESGMFNPEAANKVTTALETTNNEWEMTVAYCKEGCAGWYMYAVIGIVVMSLCISFLVYTIFSQKQFHNDDMAEKQIILVKNAKKAAKIERELNDFIAHEVRNPLSAALSACSFVSASVNELEPLKTDEAKEAVRDDVRIIDNSLQFINDLLRSMLDLHRAKSKQLTLDFSPTDIKSDILDPTASMLYRRDEMFQVVVECPDNLVASVDRLRLKQIILNLARNSAKFVEGGFVRLRAEYKKSLEPDEDGLLCIYIEDSGPGIPEEKKDKLFAKFQKTLDELSQGTGIGLSLCKKLIDLMEGTIELDHHYHSGLEGKPGAKFCVSFACPLVDVDAVSDAIAEQELISASVRSHVGGGGGSSPPLKNNIVGSSDLEEGTMTSIDSSGPTDVDEDELIQELPENLNVLFVDDDMVLRKLFTRSVKRAQPTWKIEEASNGETALIMAAGPEKSKSYDLIFLDQYMTSVEKQLLGTETARLMRSQGVTSIICGLSANDMQEPFLLAGADSFMIKPFPCKPDLLRTELLRVFNRKPCNY